MNTFRVVRPFTLSDASGTRNYSPDGPLDTVTDGELGVYLWDVDHCLASTPAPPGPSVPAEEPEL